MVSIEIHTLKSGACWIQHHQTREQVKGTSHFQMSYLSIHYLDKGGFYYLQQDLGGSLSTFCHCPKQICLPIFMTDIFKHRSKSLCGPLQPDPIWRITSFFHVNCLLKEANNIQKPRPLRISNQWDMDFLLTPSLDGSTGFHNSSKELTFQIPGQTSPGQ